MTIGTMTMIITITGAMSMTIDMAVAAVVPSHPQVPVQVQAPVKRGWLKRKRVCYRHRLRNHFDQNPEESNRLNRPARRHWCEVSRSVLPMSLLSRHQVLEPIPLEYRISCPVQLRHHDWSDSDSLQVSAPIVQNIKTSHISESPQSIRCLVPCPISPKVEVVTVSVALVFLPLRQSLYCQRSSNN